MNIEVFLDVTFT